MSLSSKIIVAAAGATILVSVAPPVYAEERTATRAGEAHKELRQLRTEAVKERCAVSNDRIEGLTSRYKNNKDLHINNYRHMVETYQKLITKLKAQGLDTSKLEADAKVLNDKIVAFGVAYDAWIAQLNVAKQYNCGDSQGQFKTEMIKARDLAIKMQQAANEVRSYFVGTIRPDIQALRKQKAETTP